MREVTGDCWAYAEEAAADAVCVLTNMTVRNGLLVMGSGQAREAAWRWGQLRSLWAGPYLHRQAVGLRCNVLWTPAGSCPNQPYALVSFPTKDRVSDSSTLELVQRSCEELAAMATINDAKNVVLPRPGCGLGGLRWVDVKPVLAAALDDRFAVITWADELG